MENFTPWQKSCAHEAVRMALEAVREWLPQAAKVRGADGQDQEITDEKRVELGNKIELAMTDLKTMTPTEFDVQEMFKSGHGEILFNCLEFYGEYIHSMLTFIGHMYRASFKERFGMLPEEIQAVHQQNEAPEQA
jgi:hypothetical protein